MLRPSVSALWVCALWVTIHVSFPAPVGAINIEFDYSLDRPFPFFDTQEKKDVLEAAAAVYEPLVTDHLAAIMPSGSNSWQLSIPNPSTGGLSLQLNQSIPEDTIRIFVGGRHFPVNDIASVDIGLRDGSGSDAWISVFEERGQDNAVGLTATDFGAGAAALSFDKTTPAGGARNWHFDLNAPPPEDYYDFFSAALHEIPKILGIGTADSWDAWIDWDTFEFRGRHVLSEFGGPVLIDDSAPDNPTHWAPGTLSETYPDGEERDALNSAVCRQARAKR